MLVPSCWAHLEHSDLSTSMAWFMVFKSIKNLWLLWNNIISFQGSHFCYAANTCSDIHLFGCIWHFLDQGSKCSSSIAFLKTKYFKFDSTFLIIFSLLSIIFNLLSINLYRTQIPKHYTSLKSPNIHSCNNLFRFSR